MSASGTIQLRPSLYCRLLIVDELETQLHTLLASLLWTAFQHDRSDIRFLYLTHDLSFALSRTNAEFVLASPIQKAQGDMLALACIPKRPDRTGFHQSKLGRATTPPTNKPADQAETPNRQLTRRFHLESPRAQTAKNRGPTTNSSSSSTAISGNWIQATTRFFSRWR